MNLTVGKVYAVFSEAGATATLRNGAVLEFPAGQPVTLVAQQATLELDGDAVVREIPNGSAVLLGEMLERQNGLPDGYTRVEYLESNGNQWVDTEFTPTTPENFQAHLVVFVKSGNRLAQGISCAFCSSFWVTPIEEGWAVSGNSPNESFSVPLQTKVKIDLRPDEVSIIGEKMQISTSFLPKRNQISSYPEESRSVKLFAFRDGASYKSEWLKGNIYEFKAQYANRKTHMFPALDETGTPCFYCLDRKMVFYNKGTGDFLYPGKETEVSTFSLRRPVTYAQLTEHGVRRLYRVPRGYNGTKEEYAMEHGFKPLVETPQPEEGYWAPEWRETDEEIVLEWVETEPPTDDYLTQPTE